MKKIGVRFSGGHMPLTFANLRGLEFDFESRYKSKVATGYRKDVLQRVSCSCDTCGHNESRLCRCSIGGSEYFPLLSLWLPSLCSILLAKLRFLLFDRG